MAYQHMPGTPRKPKNPPPPDNPEIPSILAFLRVAIGPVFVLGGIGMMSSYYWLGVGLVALGWLLTLLEVMWEPWLLTKPIFIQIGTICVLWALGSLFTIKVVLADAPVGVIAYLGGTQEGSEVAGIKWNNRFTDLRVALNDSGPDDYDSLNVLITPDSYTHAAAIAVPFEGCKLSPEPGDVIIVAEDTKGGPDTFTGTNTFGNLGMHDSQGNTFVPFVYHNGFRLFCKTLPSHFTVELIFASVTTNNELLKHISTPQLGPGQWGYGLAEFKKDSPNDSIWDFLGSRPKPSLVRLTGSYKRGSRTYTMNKTIRLGPE